MTKVHQIDLATCNGHDISPYWKDIMCIGRAKDLLREDVRWHLRDVVQDIKFKSIRFHGIFDDAMMVYQEDDLGNVHLCFEYIDQVFDFLLSIQVKPFVEIGFMPKALAKNQTPYFYSPCYPSPPKNIKKWTHLLQSFIHHLFERYGKGEVTSWKFEFWNEPELLDVFWKGSDNEFFDFYAASYHAIKEVSQRLYVGGPSISQVNGMETWLDHYLSYCQDNDCLPDFFTFHFYPHDQQLQTLAHELLTGKHAPRISPNPNFLNDGITRFLEFLKPYGYPKEKIYITEWNASASHRELINDTLYKAAYIVKNITQNFNTLHSLAHWTISDIIEELPPVKQPFHGGVGLLTKEGIKKAGYFAYTFLNQLGSTLLYQCDHFILTQKNQEFQLLMYNYCHPDEMYCHNDRSMINDISRYNVFENNESIDLKLILQHFPQGPALLTEYKLSKTHGSAFDLWLEMGHSDTLSPEEIKHLKSVQPRYHKQGIVVTETFELTRTLQPHEVILIKIKY